jgi:LruC domain-containing protein
MKKHLLPLIMGMAILASSCKKDNIVQEAEMPATNDIVVPTSFNWQTTRDVNFSVGISDSRFQNQIHVVAIYLTDPQSGATPISKGAATLISPFNAKLSIPAGINEVYVAKFAPDASTSVEKVSVTSTKVSVALASVSKSAKVSSTSVPSKVMATVDEPDCRNSQILGGDINLRAGDVLCYNIYFTNPTIDLSANSGGTVKLNAPGRTITIVNYNHTNLKLFIAEGTTVRFNNAVEIKTGEAIVNDGTIMVSDLNVAGTLVNNGTITATGSALNLNGTASVLTNNGTLNALNATMTVAGLVTNNSALNVKAATFNANSSLNNYCNLSVNNDFTANSTNLNNYKLINVKGSTYINSGGGLSMNSLSMFQTANLLTMDGIVTGRGLFYSLFKVTGTVDDKVANNDGVFRGTIQYCGTRDPDVNANNKKHFELFATKGCSLSIPKDECNPLGGGAAVVTDSDGDGVSDLLDDYPNDKTKAFKNYSVNYDNGGSTVAFEDNWPKKGDFDLNDIVLNYKHLIVTNKDNIVVRVEGEWNLLATGGEFQNGAGVQFPLPKGSATNFVSSNSLSPEAGQDSLVVILFKNGRAEQATWNTRSTEPASPAKKYTFAFDITNGPTLIAMGAGGYNPFIWNSTPGYGRGYETHLQGKKGTNLVDSKLFNTLDDKSTTNNKTYSTATQQPWAIEIPQASFAYPLEAQDISRTYLKFASWASSGGTKDVDWYSNTGAGYRDASKIFTGAK